MNIRNKIVSLTLLLTLMLMGCTRQNAVQPVPMGKSSQAVQSGITETIPIESSNIQLVNPGEKDVLDDFYKYHAAFLNGINTTHWIQQISTQNIYMEQTQTYTNAGVLEEWYRFDEDGNFVEGYNWLMSSDGTIEQESCLYNGLFYNVTLGSSGKSEVRTTRIDFTGGFADRFQNGKNLQHEQVEYQGETAEKFSYEMKDGIFEFVHVIYFDTVTHYILGRETWRKESDGSTKLVSNMVITTFIVDAEPPLDHFERILVLLPE